MGRSKRSLVGLLALGALWLPLSAYAEPEPAPAAAPAPPEVSPTETLDDAVEIRGQANSDVGKYLSV